MRNVGLQVKFALALLLLSAATLTIHYLLFQDASRIVTLYIENLALIFFNVLLVTLVIQNLINDREKRAKLNKLNMVIGAFFSEVGVKLLGLFSRYDADLDKISKELVITDKWSDRDFATVSKKLLGHDYKIDPKKVDFKSLREFLNGKRNFMLRLLENPNLLEHESFTELLRAVFHLTEELQSREKLTSQPTSDYKHLAGDVERAYIQLTREWLDYMEYLKVNYPYLFSLAMRTNPFDANASPTVK